MASDSQGYRRRDVLGALAAGAAWSAAAGRAAAQDSTPAAERDYPLGLPLERQWRYEFTDRSVSLDASGSGTIDLALDADDRYRDSRLVRLDAETGEELWEHDVDADVTSVATAGDRVVYATSEEVRGYDPEADEVVWTTAGDYAFVSPLARDGDAVYAVSYVYERENPDEPYVADGSTLLKIDASSGEVLWERDGRLFAVPSWQDPDGPLFSLAQVAAIEDDTKTVRTSDAVALDRETGEELWRNGSVRADQLRIGPDAVYVLDRRRQVVALDPGTGDERWRVRASGDLEDLAVGDGRVFYGTADGSLVARDLDSRSQQWERSLDAIWDVGYDEGLVYVGHDGGTFAALDPATGETVWTHDQPGDERPYVRTAGDRVFAVSSDALTAFLGRRGRLRRAVAAARDPGLTGPLADLAGYSGLLDEAEAAVDAGDYDRARSLLDRARSRKSTVDAVAAGAAGVAAYAGSRRGNQFVRRRELRDLEADLREAYPISGGAFDGLRPERTLARSADVGEEYDSRTGLGVLRGTVRDAPHEDLEAEVDALVRIADCLATASDVLASEPFAERSGAFRERIERAVESGDVDELRTLDAVLERGLPYYERTRSILERIEATPDWDPDGDRLAALTHRMVADPDQRDLYGPLTEAFLDAADAYLDAREDLAGYDLDPLAAEFDECLTAAADPDPALVTRVENLAGTLAALRSIERDLGAADFTFSDLDAATVREVAEAAARDGDLGDLTRLADRVAALADGSWGRDELAAFDGRSFGELVETLYEAAGYETTRLTDEAAAADLVAENDEETVAIVLLSAGEAGDLGRADVQQAVGEQSKLGADRTVFITKGEYALAARSAGEDLAETVTLVHGPRLASMLTDSPLSPPAN